MERGLFWLSLLAVFFGLAWAGRKEYQKVEAYRLWAEQFERAKYDLYAVIGQQGDELTWGTPTSQGIVDTKTFSLKQVQSIQLLVDGKTADWENPPPKGRAELEFSYINSADFIRIPFTEPPLAAQWGQFLQKRLESY
ncbi:hypothetical protein JOY44_06060 [Phormidium sp. CLA17]|uniref:hypothetical protein n=1 Tax=Leptolyngbya sp. Cla-17 TaxID=2803751 RepID=UPI0014909620|nr:hypothetical protein [Leptolyngbya sp. Cla-17]MBM0741186.1 hypothetical protein [Leptolyngbya sp. Cla-17]